MFTVRRAVVEDCDGIYGVHMNAITKICASTYTTEEIAGWISGKTAGGYAPPIAVNDFFVAESSGRIVGFSEYRPEDCEIAAVYVHAEWVRRGIGGALLRAAEAGAQNRRASIVHLSATLNAVPFYETFGYSVQQLGGVQLSSGVVLRCAFMQKQLTAG